MPEELAEQEVQYQPGFVIFTALSDAESYQAQADILLGYPEPLDRFIQAGGGVHGDPEVGRAYHYFPIDENDAGDAWALKEVIGIEHSGTVVSELPEGWRPVIEEM